MNRGQRRINWEEGREGEGVGPSVLERRQTGSSRRERKLKRVEKEKEKTKSQEMWVVGMFPLLTPSPLVWGASSLKVEVQHFSGNPVSCLL